ncbi:hypothetical protein [Azospirillum largimobile]
MTTGSVAVPTCVSSRLRRLTGIAGALALAMLALLLWQGGAAACPHGGHGDGPAPAAMAQHHLQSTADHCPSAPAHRQAPGGIGGSQGSYPYGALQPCCGGLACAAVAVAAPGEGLTVPSELAAPAPGWPAGPLRKGQGVRPDLPPPRLG